MDTQLIPIIYGYPSSATTTKALATFTFIIFLLNEFQHAHSTEHLDAPFPFRFGDQFSGAQSPSFKVHLQMSLQYHLALKWKSAAAF